MKKPKYVDIDGRIYMRLPKKMMQNANMDAVNADIAMIMPQLDSDEIRKSTAISDLHYVFSRVGEKRMCAITEICKLFEDAEDIVWVFAAILSKKKQEQIITAFDSLRTANPIIDDMGDKFGSIGYTTYICVEMLTTLYPDTEAIEIFARDQINHVILNVSPQSPLVIRNMLIDYVCDIKKLCDKVCLKIANASPESSNTSGDTNSISPAQSKDAPPRDSIRVTRKEASELSDAAADLMRISSSVAKEWKKLENLNIPVDWSLVTSLFKNGPDSVVPITADIVTQYQFDPKNTIHHMESADIAERIALVGRTMGKQLMHWCDGLAGLRRKLLNLTDTLIEERSNISEQPSETPQGMVSLTFKSDTHPEVRLAAEKSIEAARLVDRNLDSKLNFEILEPEAYTWAKTLFRYVGDNYTVATVTAAVCNSLISGKADEQNVPEFRSKLNQLTHSLTPSDTKPLTQSLYDYAITFEDFCIRHEQL